MRFVIKEYLSTLKEKDEIDLLLCDLLFQMGYITNNIPKTGNRQFGVDISAYNDEETLLCVVKQGNLNKRVWDCDPNAVRESLNEIKDCYFRQMTDLDRSRRIHIVVVTNGVIDEALRPNWQGYVNANKNWEGSEVLIDFWGIDKLTDDVQKYLFDEHIFESEMQKNLRRALYYVDESEYRNEYYENIINALIDQLDKNDNVRNRERKLTALHMATQMMASYSADSKVFKISIMISEYLIIRYWNFLFENELFENKVYVSYLWKFVADYEKWNEYYYEDIKSFCEGEDRFPNYNNTEQRLKLLEVLGFLTVFDYHLTFKYHNGKNNTGEKFTNLSASITNTIISFLNNYPQLTKAPYDCHIGIYGMLFRLLIRLKRTDETKYIIHILWEQYIYNYRIGRYPTGSDTFADAVNIDLGLPADEYLCSGYLGYLLAWTAVLSMEDEYDKLQNVLNSDLKNVTKCVWFLRSDEEKFLYSPNAMNLAGDGFALNTKHDYKKFKEELDFIRNQYKTEVFSFEEYSFEELEFILCRYYWYSPRIIF